MKTFALALALALGFSVAAHASSDAEVKNVTLADGTEAVVTGDMVEVGGKPAPDGEHKLSDGSTITTKDGKIVE